MPSYRTGTVRKILEERPGLQRVEVDHGAGGARRAYTLTRLVGTVAIGDRVVVNTTAVDLGLGTGGWDVVHWNLERDEWSEPGPGHIMKLRYTSLQVDTGCSEETPGYRSSLLGAVPVVACDLHSQMGVVAAVINHIAPDLRVVYLMTDGGALPIVLSDLVHELKEKDILSATVTCGHAFGGDFEAVNIASGLEVAVAVAGADVVVAGIGPGAVGTGTARGHSGMDVAALVGAATARSGSPVVAVRYSEADDRERHQNVSWHTIGALEGATHETVVALPSGWRFDSDAWAELGVDVRVVDVPDVAAILSAAGLVITSMGRGIGDDPWFYVFAAAAGVAAVGIVAEHARLPDLPPFDNG